MRHFILIACLGVMCVASCQKVPSPGKQAQDITFRVTTENTTKSTAITTQSLRSKEFYLYALSTGGNNPYTVENECWLDKADEVLPIRFADLIQDEGWKEELDKVKNMTVDYFFGPERISYVDQKWIFNREPYKWPKVDEENPKKLSFFAIAPTTSASHVLPFVYLDNGTGYDSYFLGENISDTFATTPYATLGAGIVIEAGGKDNDAVEQEDILIAFTPNRTAEQGQVPLTFKHALSAVNICVGDIDATLKTKGLTVKKAGVVHALKTCICTVGLLEEPVLIGGVLDDSAIADYYQKNPTLASALTTQTDQNTFWLCPQKKSVRIELEYEYDGHVTTAGKTLNVNWEPGKVYTYRVNILKEYSGEIIIDCENVTIEKIIEEDIYDLNY
ncbi:MAG: fimbrillin family protein [Bacteroidales bacterium]|nr:fimbrillin family protein [Bacteroidales bacterium]